MFAQCEDGCILPSSDPLLYVCVQACVSPQLCLLCLCTCSCVSGHNTVAEVLTEEEGNSCRVFQMTACFSGSGWSNTVMAKDDVQWYLGVDMVTGLLPSGPAVKQCSGFFAPQLSFILLCCHSVQNMLQCMLLLGLLVTRYYLCKIKQQLITYR